jgi:hypothetical protein
MKSRPHDSPHDTLDAEPQWRDCALTALEQLAASGREFVWVGSAE